MAKLSAELDERPTKLIVRHPAFYVATVRPALSQPPST
jgi:hypothetical protein